MKSKQRKSERLYVRVTPEFKRDISQLAWREHDGSITELLESALKDYLKKYSEVDEV